MWKKNHLQYLFKAYIVRIQQKKNNKRLRIHLLSPIL